ncbi:hypothetical protein Afil01_11750 [Actinorhabdospora filicis]|uniref:Uncharacterized protein n=1 Tax=Actinorhabdospora filicis TaxID=1785913 RepID=A0A9W6SHG8_9ACTN|nr:hypothetical protein Afil01_11750 [Actinorhabdospora filicis]
MTPRVAYRSLPLSERADLRVVNRSRLKSTAWSFRRGLGQVGTLPDLDGRTGAALGDDGGSHCNPGFGVSDMTDLGGGAGLGGGFGGVMEVTELVFGGGGHTGGFACRASCLDPRGSALLSSPGWRFVTVALWTGVSPLGPDQGCGPWTPDLSREAPPTFGFEDGERRTWGCQDGRAVLTPPEPAFYDPSADRGRILSYPERASADLVTGSRFVRGLRAVSLGLYYNELRLVPGF